MNYTQWLGMGGVLFLAFIPVVWWGLGQYLYVNWTQSALISGIFIGSVMYYIEATSDHLKGDKED